MNGKKELTSQRDYIVATYTEVTNIKDWIAEHKKTHRFIWVAVTAIPPAMYYLVELLKKI